MNRRPAKRLLALPVLFSTILILQFAIAGPGVAARSDAVAQAGAAAAAGAVMILMEGFEGAWSGSGWTVGHDTFTSLVAPDHSAIVRVSLRIEDTHVFLPVALR